MDHDLTVASDAECRTRLHRIEGQVRGLEHMLDDHRDCFELLTQIRAVTNALQSLGVLILDAHLRAEVTEDNGYDAQQVAEEMRAGFGLLLGV